MISVKKDENRSSKGNDGVMREFSNAVKRFGLVRKVRDKDTYSKDQNRRQRRAAANRSRKQKEHFEYMLKTGKLARMKKNKNQRRRSS